MVLYGNFHLTHSPPSTRAQQGSEVVGSLQDSGSESIEVGNSLESTGGGKAQGAAHGSEGSKDQGAQISPQDDSEDKNVAEPTFIRKKKVPSWSVRHEKKNEEEEEEETSL